MAGTKKKKPVRKAAKAKAPRKAAKKKAAPKRAAPKPVRVPPKTARPNRRKSVARRSLGHRPVQPHRVILPGAGKYDSDLDRNPANYQPLTPLTFLERRGLRVSRAHRHRSRRTTLHL